MNGSALNDTENGRTTHSAKNNLDPNSYKLKTFQSLLNWLAHIFIGITVGTILVFVFSNGLPIGATPTHIVLCVLGYHLLMAQAILSLTSDNGWSSHMRLVDKRRAHWILQIMGSSLAIAGSFIKIYDKTSHWTSTHGQFALVALVFTTVNLVSGVATLWSYELRRCLPTKWSKLSHICLGVVGFGAATITLCYGIEKSLFTNWAGTGIANTLIAFIAAYATIIIINPVISFIIRLRNKN